MKRVLIICSSVDSPNGICARAVISEMEKHGIRVDCICSGGNLPHSSAYTKYYITKDHWFENLQKDKESISLRQYKLRLMLSRVKAVLLAPIWPLDSPVYYNSLLKAARTLIKQSNYDAVIGIHNQFECLLTAYQVKRLCPDTKFIAYFLDSLSGGVLPRFMPNLMAYKIALRAERYILKSADSVVIMKSHTEHCNKVWRDEVWKDKIKVLDIPLFVQGEKNGVTANKLSASSINILYTGALQANLKNPQYFLELLSLQDFSDVTVTFIGPSNCDAILRAAQEKTQATIVQKPPVSHDAAMELLQGADILLNIGSLNTRQIPCKIFEYMAVGKPIISIAPTRDEPSIQYLKEYPKALILYEDKNIEENATRLKEFLSETKTPSVDLKQLEKALYICTPKAFVENLENLIDS